MQRVLIIILFDFKKFVYKCDCDCKMFSLVSLEREIYLKFGSNALLYVWCGLNS
jgi:hypothetical protein